MKKTKKIILLACGVLGVAVAPLLTASFIGRPSEVHATGDNFVTTTDSFYTTQRIWIYVNFSGWNDAGAVTAVRTWGSSNVVYYTHDFTITVPGEDLAVSYTYKYADVPLSINGYQFVRINPSNLTNIWTYSPDGTLSLQKSSVAYINAFSGDGSLTYGGIKDNVSSPDMCAKVLEGYTTCLPNDQNGYMAVPTIQTNFISHLTESDVSTFNSLAISDYSAVSYESNGNTYSDTVEKTAVVGVGDKLAKMQALSNSLLGSNTLINQQDNLSSSTFIVVLCLLSFLLTGSYVISHKKLRGKKQ